MHRALNIVFAVTAASIVQGAMPACAQQWKCGTFDSVHGDQSQCPGGHRSDGSQSGTESPGHSLRANPVELLAPTGTSRARGIRQPGYDGVTAVDERTERREERGERRERAPSLLSPRPVPLSFRRVAIPFPRTDTEIDRYRPIVRANNPDDLRSDRGVAHVADAGPVGSARIRQPISESSTVLPPVLPPADLGPIVPIAPGDSPGSPGDSQPADDAIVPPVPGEPAPRADGRSPVSIFQEPNEDEDALPPLEEELWWHGGAYLYEAEGDRLNRPDECDECSDVHTTFLRLPENWQKPRPLTHFQEFLGADPIHPRPGLQWFGEEGFQWEPRFVGYGSYEIFGIAVEDGGLRTDGIGHQALVDLDLRLTGTERFHVQFRPLGEKNSGGSFYQFNDPSGYQDHSTGVPDRWWFEGELFSVFGGLFDDEFTPRDYHVVVGKFPFALHNRLLMNDDIVGVAVNKNTLLISPLSNLNVQLFYGFDDVDGFGGANLDVAGVHLTADYRHALLEATYAATFNSGRDDLNAHYAAFSATRFFGPMTFAGRVLTKWSDAGRRGDGQLYVLESNLHRVMPRSFECATGIEHAVFYLNAFKATSGWNPISGGNFDRLRSTFEVNPLVQIARGVRVDDTAGVSLGVQLFRHHDDESIIPEVVWEESDGEAIFGGGVRYLRKIGPRTYIQLQGVRTWSDDDTLAREGAFVSTFFIL